MKPASFFVIFLLSVLSCTIYSLVQIWRSAGKTSPNPLAFEARVGKFTSSKYISCIYSSDELSSFGLSTYAVGEACRFKVEDFLIAVPH